MTVPEPAEIKRFGVFRISEHWLNALVFSILVVTGLSQRFHEYTLSHWIVTNLGGVDAVRLVHRYSGIVFTALTVAHLTMGSLGVLLKKWRPTMVINLNDFTDAIDNMKYYLGLANHPAQCGRYDYKQKFEYWGVVVGGLLMIATGLTLWFPVFVASLLPGEVIPAAKALHTNEALLAFLVIITWHIYNAIFSPEVFPLDRAIFSGYISRERMVHEHPRELAELEGKTLEEITSHHLDNAYAEKEHA